MDIFCGSKFWDSNLTWYTHDPQFSRCFEETVLVWIPCFFLWLFASLEVFYVINSRNRDIPWNFLNLSKLCLTCTLIILKLTDLVIQIFNKKAIYSVDVFSPCCQIITYVLAAVLLYLDRKYGLRTSGVLFLFWLFLLLSGIPQIKSKIREIIENNQNLAYSSVSYLIYYTLVVSIFFLSCFVDQAPTRSKYSELENPSLEEQSSFLSKLTFNWFNSAAWNGIRQNVFLPDIWNLSKEDVSKEVVLVFEKYWEKPTKLQSSSSYAAFERKVDSVNFGKDVIEKRKQISIIVPLAKAFGSVFLFGSFLHILQIIVAFTIPLILKLLILFVENKEEKWKGYFYCTLLFCTVTIQSLLLSQYHRKMVVCGMRFQSALTSAIYKKILRVSDATMNDISLEKIVNLVAVDTEMFVKVPLYLDLIWSAPLQIILALYFLWQILGTAVLTGLTVLIISILINNFITTKIKVLQVEHLKNKEERARLLNEALSGIKVLKFYAWESSFEEQILKTRRREIRLLKEISYFNAVLTFLRFCSPFVESIAAFTTFLFIDESNVLHASTAFVSLLLFNMLRVPLYSLPEMVSALVQTAASVQRLNNFFNVSELSSDNVEHEPKEEFPLVIEDGTFSWNRTSVLKEINLRFDDGELVAVVGESGAGKTSLILAFLGEMNKISGNINRVGRIAYVPQRCWIQNATLQDNILFGKRLDEAFYDTVLEASTLKPLLIMLPFGDQTVIGEKGVNLTFDQMQKVSFARAVYANADIYLLDDPLSALDKDVGEYIFEKVLGQTGLLDDRTRILVTNNVKHLPNVDKIVVLKNGRIFNVGTYEELSNTEDAFAEFLKEHAAEVSKEGQNGELPGIQKSLSATSIHKKMYKDVSRRSSRSSNVNFSLGHTLNIPSRRSSRASNVNFPLGHSLSITDSLHRRCSVRSIREEHSSKTSISAQLQDNQNDEILIRENLLLKKTLERENTKALYKYYLKSIGILLSSGIIFLYFVNYCFGIATNYWLSVWTSDQNLIINETLHPTKRDLYLGIYGALGLCQGLFVLASSAVKTIGCIHASVSIHHMLINRVLRWPLNAFEIMPADNVLNRFSIELQTVDVLLPVILEEFVLNIMSVTSIIFAVSFTTPIFLSLVLPLGALYIFILQMFMRTSRQLSEAETSSKSDIFSYFGETITGVTVIRAYGQQERFVRGLEERLDYTQNCHYSNQIAKRWLALRADLIGSLVIFFAALFAILKENQNSGLIGFSISYALQITQNLNFLAKSAFDVQTTIPAIKKIMEIEEIPQEPAWDIPKRTPPRHWPEEGAIEFKHYSAKYQPDFELVLRDINFTIKGGEKISIVGKSGAGKSSLMHALFRIIRAAKGEILIDNVNIAEIGLHDLRSRMSIVPQEPIIFSGSLRMNLDPFNEYSDENIWKSLEKAHLKPFVEGLPAGLNHKLLEKDESLSIEQKYLICLSRALLKMTKIVVLEEMMDFIDVETDELIQEIVKREFKDSTVLTITRRLNTIMDSDNLMVLDNGRLMEFDSPEVLVADRHSMFYYLVKSAEFE